MLLINPNANFSTGNIGWRGAVLSDPSYKDIYSLHLLGTDFKSPFASSDSRTQDLGDYSSQNRVLTKTGAPAIGTNNAALDSTDYYAEGFSADTLAAVTGGLTLCAIGKFPNVSTGIYGNYNGASALAVSLEIAGSGAYQAIANLSGTTKSAAISSDSYRGTGYEFLAMTADNTQVTIYRINPNGASTPVTTARTGTPGGGGSLRIGRSVDTTFTAASNMAMTLAYSAVKTSGQITAIYNDCKSFLAGLPHPVAI